MRDLFSLIRRFVEEECPVVPDNLALANQPGSCIMVFILNIVYLNLENGTPGCRKEIFPARG
jgi:hypothetical protein